MKVAPTPLPKGVHLVDNFGDASINSPDAERRMYAITYLEDNTVVKVQRRIDRLAASQKSKVMTMAQWQEHIDAVKAWNSESASVDNIPLSCKTFYRNNKSGKWIKDFTANTNLAGHNLCNLPVSTMK